MGIELNKTAYSITADKIVDDSDGLDGEDYPFRKAIAGDQTTYVVEAYELIEDNTDSIRYDKQTKTLRCKEFIER